MVDSSLDVTRRTMWPTLAPGPEPPVLVVTGHARHICGHRQACLTLVARPQGTRDEAYHHETVWPSFRDSGWRAHRPRLAPDETSSSGYPSPVFLFLQPG